MSNKRINDMLSSVRVDETGETQMRSAMPALPPSVQFDPALGSNACPWLDQYIQYSKIWAPRAYEHYHEAIGIWVMATAAAGRIEFNKGGPEFTNLYIALVSRTTSFTKTTAAKIGVAHLRAAGLGFLLAPDDATPEAFVSRMVRSVPLNYDKLLPSEQCEVEKRIAQAGQMSWFYDELGQQISGMMKHGGYLAAFRSILRRFYDTSENYERRTKSGGIEIVRDAHLSILGCTTPADLRPFAGRGAPLWNDGFWPRFALIAPSVSDRRSKERFPTGQRDLNPQLVDALMDWHERLGVPAVSIDADLSATVDPIRRTKIEFGPGVFTAFGDYDDALGDIIADNPDMDDLAGNYGHFAGKALKIAALMASLSGSKRIEMQHWVRAQEITERWRQCLHNLYDQLISSVDETREARYEQAIIGYIQKAGSVTSRDITKNVWGIDTGTAKSILDNLCEAEILVKAVSGKKVVFALAG